MFEKKLPKTAVEWYAGLDRSVEVFNDEFVYQGFIVKDEPKEDAAFWLKSKHDVPKPKRIRRESVVAGTVDGTRYLITDGTKAHAIVLAFLKNLDEGLSKSKDVLGGARRMSVLKRYGLQLLEKCAVVCSGKICQEPCHEICVARVFKAKSRKDIYVCEAGAALSCVLLEAHTSEHLTSEEDALRLDRMMLGLGGKIDWWKDRAVVCEGATNG